MYQCHSNAGQVRSLAKPGATTNTHPSLAAAAAGVLLSSSSPDVSSLKKSSGRLVSAWKTLVLKTSQFENYFYIFSPDVFSPKGSIPQTFRPKVGGEG